MAWLCEGAGKYPAQVWEEYVRLDERNEVLFRTNDLGAEQLNITTRRLFGKCSRCGSSGYQITDAGTLRIHHLFW